VRKAGEADSLYDKYDLNGWGGYGKYDHYGRQTEVITPQKADEADILSRLVRMTTSNIKNWVRKASVDEIAEVIAEAADKIYGLEDEIAEAADKIYELEDEIASLRKDDDHITKGMNEW